MSVADKYTHTEDEKINHDDIIVDSDTKFTINTTTRAISSEGNEKLSLMQYDDRSERYSFHMDRIIDKHDLMLCNRVTIHFINKGSGKGTKSNVYPVKDMHVDPDNENKIIFSWLIAENATQLSGALHFLVMFECIADDGMTVLYRWSSDISDKITIRPGMNNGNEIIEIYSDELLAWQHEMEVDHIPTLVNKLYDERNFASSEEIALIFDMSDSDDIKSMSVDDMPTEGSDNLVKSGGVKAYVDAAIQAALETALANDVSFNG